MQQDLRSLSREELTRLFREWQQPTYRVAQVLRWVHLHRAIAWDQMTNLPEPLRERLAASFSLTPLDLFQKQGSSDTTQKFLWRLSDGAFVESVLIPANPAFYGDQSDRHTLCVSTQVGCAYGCRFCASGLDGWKRNLSPSEMIDQVYGVERWNVDQARRRESSTTQPASLPRSRTPRLINNLVIMGMGEPLANYENLLQALHILNAAWGGNIGARKITVSTSGLAPQIRKLADDALPVRLAISLHGATDDVRSRIMPVNRKYPLEALVSACDYYQTRKKGMITFEYILIAGINDAPDQLTPLAALARRLHAKVNLIPYNTVQGLPWKRPSARACDAFADGLKARGITATLRREKGHDIDAACGQLRLRTEQALAGIGR